MKTIGAGLGPRVVVLKAVGLIKFRLPKPVLLPIIFPEVLMTAVRAVLTRHHAPLTAGQLMMMTPMLIFPSGSMMRVV